MLKLLSIKSLYELALTEGEGVGTAYEYYVKRLLLRAWLRQIGRPQRILVAGLPEQYGASLDFLQLAAEVGAAVTVVDERPSALARLQQAFAGARERQRLIAVSPTLIQVDSLIEMAPVAPCFDLCLSSEVLQRLETVARSLYTTRLRQLAPAVALFAPNADNQAHTTISGLAGVSRLQMNRLVQDTVPVSGRPLPQTGYIDMPPFPPGITRTEEQRAQASTGLAEAIIMQGLEGYAHLEPFLPLEWRRHQSHIVYAFLADKER